MNEILDKVNRASKEIKKVIIGKDEIVDKIMATIIADGHILLEDIPGVGKTTLALALSKVSSLAYKRLQFTPDVLPTDVTGFSLYNKKTNEFEYVEGAAVCNLLLADEINRTSPKTQSALLEVMEEGKVTVDGVTRQIPRPFNVIATQNPLGSIGTQKLPESQLDRFMVRLSMGYPDKESEIDILKGESSEKLEKLEGMITGEEIIEAQKLAQNVYVRESIYEYIVELVGVTRNCPYTTLGISPRGTIAILRLAKAMAFMDGRDYVGPKDVQNALFDAGMHRIVISSKANAEGLNSKAVLEKIIALTDAPGVV